jgi:hypothetical protein
MGPDAEWEEGAGPGGGEGLDWRLHMEKATLTDKQMKLVDKIRWVWGGLTGFGEGIFVTLLGFEIRWVQWVQGGVLRWLGCVSKGLSVG